MKNGTVSPARAFTVANLNIFKPIWRWARVQPPRVLLNLGLLFTLTSVVLVSGLNQSAANSAPVNNLAINNKAPATVLPEVDQTATLYIAANVATQLKLPVINEIAKKVDSVEALSSSGIDHDGGADKPVIVQTEGAVSREILAYTSVEGDTLKSIAKEYGIQPETLAWANGLNVNDELLANTELKIPPIDGVLYTAQAGDTPESLANRYNSTAAEIISFNDLDVYPLKAGKLIMIPGGNKPEPVAITNTQTPSVYRSAFLPAYNGNGYDWGWCTWWVAERRRQLGASIPSNWGNANTWDDLASATGSYRLSSSPVPGAIAQTDAGWAGHVAVVEEVSSDGTKVKISDMNGLAGWGVVGTGWVSVSAFETYIH